MKINVATFANIKNDWVKNAKASNNSINGYAIAKGPNCFEITSYLLKVILNPDTFNNFKKENKRKNIPIYEVSQLSKLKLELGTCKLKELSETKINAITIGFFESK